MLQAYFPQAPAETTSEVAAPWVLDRKSRVEVRLRSSLRTQELMPGLDVRPRVAQRPSPEHREGGRVGSVENDLQAPGLGHRGTIPGSPVLQPSVPSKSGAPHFYTPSRSGFSPLLIYRCVVRTGVYKLAAQMRVFEAGLFREYGRPRFEFGVDPDRAISPGQWSGRSTHWVPSTTQGRLPGRCSR